MHIWKCPPPGGGGVSVTLSWSNCSWQRKFTSLRSLWLSHSVTKWKGDRALNGDITIIVTKSTTSIQVQPSSKITFCTLCVWDRETGRRGGRGQGGTVPPDSLPNECNKSGEFWGEIRAKFGRPKLNRSHTCIIIIIIISIYIAPNNYQITL